MFPNFEVKNLNYDDTGAIHLSPRDTVSYSWRSAGLRCTSDPLICRSLAAVVLARSAPLTGTRPYPPPGTVHTARHGKLGHTVPSTQSYYLIVKTTKWSRSNLHCFFFFFFFFFSLTANITR